MFGNLAPTLCGGADLVNLMARAAAATQNGVETVPRAGLSKDEIARYASALAERLAADRGYGDAQTSSGCL